jgi:hypothetical protein
VLVPLLRTSISATSAAPQANVSGNRVATIAAASAFDGGGDSPPSFGAHPIKMSATTQIGRRMWTRAGG